MICSLIFIHLTVLSAQGFLTAKATPAGATSSKDSSPPSPLGPFEAFDNQFPYMVSIRRTEFELMFDEGIHICAGALITEQVVLTAAHCIFDMFGNYVGSRSALTVVAGSKYINGGNSSRIHRRASKVFVYPSFSRYTREADLAVLVLDEAITVQDDSNVNFIDVAEYPPIAGEKCFVLGWNNYTTTNISSNVLQYYVVELLPEELCKGSYYNFTKYLPANQLCACSAAFGIYNNFCNNSNLCLNPTTLAPASPQTTSILNGARVGMRPPPLPSPIPSVTLNHLQWNNRFQPGRNPDSGDPGSILICNNQITGLLAYSHRCEDIAGRPQIFTDITEYSDFVNDPSNYLPEMFKFIVHNDSYSGEDGGWGDEGRAQCEVDLVLISTLILINIRVICSHY